MARIVRFYQAGGPEVLSLVRHSIFRKRRSRGWRLILRYAPPSSGRSTQMVSFLQIATASAKIRRGGAVRSIFR
jgi:hypothetical protein